MRAYLLLALLLAAASLAAQVKKTEVVQSTTSAADSKGLDPTVPDTFVLSTRIERVVMVRFKNQTDILAGLQQAVKEHKIRNAVILSGFGSAISAHYHVVSNREFPSKNLFVENPSIPADIVNFSGAVMNGRLHPHITFAEADKAFGGHLEPRTRVFTFAVVVFGILPDDVDVSRFDDKNWR